MAFQDGSGSIGPDRLARWQDAAKPTKPGRFPPPILSGPAAVAPTGPMPQTGRPPLQTWPATASLCEGMAELGFNILPGEHPIIPIMLGDAALAQRFAEAMLAKGVYVVGFFYPVVPQGKAPILVTLVIRLATIRWELKLPLYDANQTDSNKSK